ALTTIRRRWGQNDAYGVHAPSRALTCSTRCAENVRNSLVRCALQDRMAALRGGERTRGGRCGVAVREKFPHFRVDADDPAFASFVTAV
ncbi:hypothetical protein, partial [Rhodovulum sp. PH10]|uniref:hypothetical protein n=1 Tax=Rhodovulum sp. PH10 TaxID=1187851 RepID=UPI001ED94DEB